MSSHCQRVFEVEALRDGRLGNVERARFEHHLEACETCRRRARALDDLGQALRAATELPRDQLHERRERTRLLEAFDHSLLETPSDVPRRRAVERWSLDAPGVIRQRWAWSVAALAVSIIVGILFFLAVEPPPPAALIEAGQAATWSRELTDNRELVRLVQGELRIQVERHTTGRRLVVELPDGELEDIGTIFTVAVDAGRTTHVSVREGVVLLRLAGRAPFTLLAGQTWTPNASNERGLEQKLVDATAESEATATASPIVTSPGLGVESTASTRASSSAGAEMPEPAMRTAGAPLPPATASTSTESAQREPNPVRDTASEWFRDAVATLHAGDNPGAALRFAQFVKRFPFDARAEDASYLRVLALQRSGNPDATRTAAQQYLKHYPSGFRRTEIEKLAR